MKKIKLRLTIALIFLSSALFSQGIFDAIMQGDIDNARQLIKADSTNAITKNPRGFSPIHFAANFNQLEIAKLLIKKGANPFIVGTFGRQPVHWASATGSIDVLTWLHELGADLNAKDATNKTPIFFAVTRGHKKNAEYLLSQNVNIQTEGDQAFEFLYFSILENYTDIFDAFMDSDFNFQQLTKDGSNLMSAAAQNGNTKLITFLAEKGLNINHLNDFGECALHVSIKNKNLAAMKKLLDLGADVNLSNFIGQNALSFAQVIDSGVFIEHLKLKGANPQEDYLLNKTYPDFEEPGLSAKLFAPGLISTPKLEERDAMFSPDMGEFYYSVYSRKLKIPFTITSMNNLNGNWSKPKTAEFSGKFSDGECFVSFDNQNLYFISNRPLDGGDKPSAWEIWIGDRNNDKQWGNFRLLDTTQLKGCFYPSLTRNGELLYTGIGNNLYLAKLINEKVVDTKKLGPEINTEAGEYNAMISPDGDYIIFTSHGFEDHYGGGDLYISFRKKDGSWAQAINMGPEINTDVLEYCPNISPDSKYFFFTSNKKGTEDIYWISAEIIEQLRTKHLGE